MMMSIVFRLGLGAAMAASISISAFAQQGTENSSSTEEAERNPFFQSKIPDDFDSVFRCYQNGQPIVEIANVTSFAPRSVEGIMTFSIISKGGKNHLYYLGKDTTCSLEVEPPA